MLNIPESVPPQESIPSIPELDQTRTPSDSGIGTTNSEWFRGIPSNSRITTSIIILLSLNDLTMIRFRSAIPESVAIHAIPESHGIPSDSVSIPFPEFRCGIACLFWRLILKHNTKSEGEGKREFRNR